MRCSLSWATSLSVLRQFALDARPRFFNLFVGGLYLIQFKIDKFHSGAHLLQSIAMLILGVILTNSGVSRVDRVVMTLAVASLVE